MALLKLHGGSAVGSRLAQCDDLGTAPVRDAGAKVTDAAAAVHAVQVQLLQGEAKARFHTLLDQTPTPSTTYKHLPPLHHLQLSSSSSKISSRCLPRE